MQESFDDFFNTLTLTRGRLCAHLPNLKKTGRFIERFHSGVVDDQDPGVSISYDGLQCDGVNISKMNMCLFALTEPTHKHGPTETEKQHWLKQKPSKEFAISNESTLDSSIKVLMILIYKT